MNRHEQQPHKVDLRSHRNEPYIKAEEIQRRRDFLAEKGFKNDWIQHLYEEKPTLYSVESISDKIEGLQDRGFANPQKMIQTLPAVLGLGFENIDNKIEGLQDRGFANPQKMIQTLPAVLSYSFENIDNKIEGLRDRGFANPQKMIQTLPAVLGLGFENIDNKIEGLQNRGFANPQKMIQTLPAVLSYSFENIDNKIEGLQDRGFANPQKMIQTAPTVLNYSFENIDNKIEGLQDRGFANPQKMIQTLPAVLSYSFENIDNKIEGLQDRGFANPQKMIQTLPTVLGYSFDNIDKRLSILGKLQKTYDLAFFPAEAMEKTPILWSSKKDKLFTAARVLRDANADSQKITPSFINGLLSQNLEDMLVASAIKKEDEPAERIVYLARQVKKQGLPTEAKRQIIEDSPRLSDKIKRSYFRGYPEK